ncbi:TIR domain-containing protein [Thioalkalivibrio sp. ALJ15]|uniref:TIR domain-containing protein n=1 Tax=Thioalkalivibrio sp. ALJ15 TaxID=748652 RepID=UPI000371438C|nr:nucleotide-binding protein [Thioalkalivibrio sp. ALJ15]
MPAMFDTLDELISEGEKFTYENFRATTSRHGYPAAYSEEWVVWQSRARTFLEAKFGQDSVPAQTLQKGLVIRVLGFGEEKFTNAKTMILSSLKSARASVADEVLPEVGALDVSPDGKPRSSKVFIVHGHDESAKQEMEIFLTELGLEPVVLHRKADEGRTVIEKFEAHSDVGYVFVLLTPDEFAYLASEAEVPESDRQIEIRSRPNVIFEFGYFVGKLGRNRVCCLHTGSVVLPSDLGGLVYKQYTTSIEESGYSIIKELKAGGYNVKV